MARPIWVYLVGAARKVWGWSNERREIKKQAQIGKKWKCAECKELFSKVHVDHIIGVGKSPREFSGWDDYYKRLFCSIENLQVLCVQCHGRKTKREKRNGRKLKSKK